ncbi:unnamed protein product [Vitrella brassicaformis CCMP3155]|uniref:alpha-1,2-Mannosidase n=1 Tax=Vitrella brassicaformis (strain CCMP3155) TaxID=1169540 RepID=A0A0G4GEB6_VITBC|nr:unnamed protein product [Vitrella brassicaformis CCMP3155]|eukprot:CEM27776.1 unnamed protein product [Vitrella brassicaformis CCMP3155]
MDTLFYAGLHDELDRALQWVADNLSFNRHYSANVFETTIRQLGGLLGIYSLLKPTLPKKEKDKMTDEEKRRAHQMDRVLEEAVSLGGRLLKSFPPTVTPRQWSESDCSYAEAAEATTDLIERRRQVSRHGLIPTHLKPQDLATHKGTISLGGGGDSFYEYLAKEWILTGQQDALLRAMLLGFLRRLPDVVSKTSRPPSLPQPDWSKTYGDREGRINYGGQGLVYVADLSERGRTKSARMGHLACFLPGMLMLLARTSLVWQPDEPPKAACHDRSFAPACHKIDGAFLERLADELCKTCVSMYFFTQSGLPPEGVRFSDSDIQRDMSQRNTLLRPETVESLAYMIELQGRPHYFTQDRQAKAATSDASGQKEYIFSTVTEEEESAAVREWGVRYRNWTWKIFLAMIKWAKGAHGFSALADPYAVPPRQTNTMESFVIAETFKYFLIAFSPPSTVRLDKLVFNTEAHPLPVLPDGGKCGRVARHKRRSQQTVSETT